jgi:hypothetical protein
MRYSPQRSSSRCELHMTRSFLSFLAVVAALGCGTAPFAPASTEGLALAVTLSQPALRVGQSDTITVTLTNTNRHTVSLDVGGCPLLFYVKNVAGATVVPAGGDWFCIEILRRLVLPPGQQESVSFTWDTRALVTGVYSVYGTFSGDGIHLRTPQVPVQLN